MIFNKYQADKFMLIHSYINLPNFQLLVPHSNLNVAYDNIKVNSNVADIVTTPEGENLGLIQYLREHADPIYFEYMESLIPELKGNIIEIGFQYQINYKNNPSGTQLMPHTDGPRGKFCIQWIMDLGGTDIKTTWWHEAGKPLLREPSLKRKNYDNLTLVDRVIWKQERWNILRTDILHSVYPIMTSRNAFTVSFSNEDIFNAIIEKYGTE